MLAIAQGPPAHVTSGTLSPAARQLLIQEHVPVARRIASAIARRVPAWVDIEDLRSAALLGLVEAAQRFSPARGESFLAFAERRMRGAVLDELRKGDILTRRARTAAKRVSSTIKALEHGLGRSPEDEEVAGALGVSLDTYRSDLEAVIEVGVVELTPTLERTLRDEQAVDAAAEHKQLIGGVRAALELLAVRDQQVLSLYYLEDMSYVQIGERLGVSESRVCQLHGRAIARIRAALADGE